MIFYLFIDGIGFGEKDSDKNPFTRYSKSIFLPLGGFAPSLSNLTYIETDASMGIKGLPQSATGQTSLWTGLNGPESVGRHINGFPTFTLKKIIANHSIVKVFKDSNRKADLLNSYTDYYFEKIGKNPRYQSASTLVQTASGNPLKNMDDLRSQRGLYMDITHRVLREISKDWLDPDDPILEPRDPHWLGSQVPVWFKDYDLAIFEYFITDKAGHDKNWEYSRTAIHDLEEFIEGFISGMNPDKDSLIITSDHGNMEDLTTDRHTMNPVPTILSGEILSEDHSCIRALKDIPRFIYNHLGMNSSLEELEKVSYSIDKD